MTRTRHAAAALALAALALCPAPRAAAGVAAPAADDARRAAGGFQRVPRVTSDAAPEASAFEFKAGGYFYHIAANGNGRGLRGEKTRLFNLRLDGRDYIEGLRFSVYEGDLLLLCELFDGETHAGVVMRVEQPSMRALWRSLVPAPEVGEPLRDGHDLYVTGAGFVARLDLRTGRYFWQHGDLGAGEADGTGVVLDRPFNSFETPRVEGDAVLFRERPVYNQPRTAVFKRKTGKLIRIE
ncbi:MAG TPA: hypothetical protein VF659_13975 [Pyrinomonadaceae bacterium]|jgi:hypothetical protein